MNAPLAIIVIDVDRALAALGIAAAAAALGRPVAMLFDGASVTALVAPADIRLVAALELGVTILACQSGMADGALTAADLVSGIATGGMVGFLSDQAHAQLLLA